VAAAWTVRNHTLKAPRAAWTARGGRIGDFPEIFGKKKIPIFLIFVQVGLFGTQARPSVGALLLDAAVCVGTRVRSRCRDVESSG
jgi:hypothetical protein